MLPPGLQAQPDFYTRMPTFDYLVVIEGTDGSGKATQAHFLKETMDRNMMSYLHKGECLDNSEVKILDFPQYESMTGKLVKAMLDGKYCPDAGKLNSYFTTPMYSLDRYAYMQEMYREHGHFRVGICNRYTISNLIHQGARLSEAELVKYWAWLEDFEYDKLGLPKPDLTIYLDLPSSVAHKNVVERAKKEGISLDINEDEGFMTSVEKNVYRISHMVNWDSVNCWDFENNCMRSPEDINKSIMTAIRGAVSIQGKHNPDLDKCLMPETLMSP